jgi:hypothetical protein
MMQLKWLLVIYSFFHVQQGELGRYDTYQQCVQAKLTTPITGLGNWSNCEERWVLPPGAPTLDPGRPPPPVK